MRATSGYLAKSCDQFQVGINFWNVASVIPICSLVLVLFYVSKLEVNCVKFIYGGICDGNLYFEPCT